MKGDDRVAQFDIKNNVKVGDPKATKNEFGYVAAKTNPNCGSCSMYLIGGGCTIVQGKIDPINGSCNYWAYRRTMPNDEADYEPEYIKNEAQYMETPNGPRCGSCSYYLDPGRCSKVIGDIDPVVGCCNRWEKKH